MGQPESRLVGAALLVQFEALDEDGAAFGVVLLAHVEKVAVGGEARESWGEGDFEEVGGLFGFGVEAEEFVAARSFIVR